MTPSVCLLSGIMAAIFDLFIHFILCIICEAYAADPLLLHRYQPTSSEKSMGEKQGGVWFELYTSPTNVAF